MLVFYCDGALAGSVLNLIKVESGIVYKLSANLSRPFSRELRVRGCDLTT